MLSSLWKCYLCSTTITHKERYTHQKSELPAAILFYFHAVLFTAVYRPSFERIVKASSAAVERLSGGSNESSSRERGLKTINLRLNN